MAGSARSYAERPARYFFLNKVLYRKIRVAKRQNLMVAERVYDGQRVVFLWSDVAKNGQRAFHLKNVADILKCSKRTIVSYHEKGWVDPPAIIELPDHPVVRLRRHRLYSEDHILEIWERMSVTHVGAPRGDGIIAPRRSLPSKAEVLSKIRGGQVLYVKDEMGEFHPLWKAT